MKGITDTCVRTLGVPEVRTHVSVIPLSNTKYVHMDTSHRTKNNITSVVYVQCYQCSVMLRPMTCVSSVASAVLFFVL